MIRISRDYEALCRDVVLHLLNLTKKTKGRFVLALSGGSTPQGIYALMGKAPYKKQFPWKKMHFFWGDERWIPHHHPENNYGNACRLLFSRINIPRQNIHPINTHAKRPEEAALSYGQELNRYFKNKTPIFSLIFLGLGKDGHIASLFPGHKVLRETVRNVKAVTVRGKGERITMTLPVINRARFIFMIASGPEKARVVKRVLQPKGAGRALPVEKIKLQKGKLLFFMDQAAAAGLNFKSKRFSRGKLFSKSPSAGKASPNKQTG